LDKIQSIEELFVHIVKYSYLLLPLIFLFSRKKKNDSLIIALYGLIFFFLLHFFFDIPQNIKKFYISLYTFFEYVCFASLLYINITSKKFKRLIIFLSLGFLLYQIVYYFTVPLGRIDSIPIDIESIRFNGTVK